MREVKQTSGAGNSSPAYLGTVLIIYAELQLVTRGWLRGSKADSGTG
jgi:hypothetical protein